MVETNSKNGCATRAIQHGHSSWSDAIVYLLREKECKIAEELVFLFGAGLWLELRGRSSEVTSCTSAVDGIRSKEQSIRSCRNALLLGLNPLVIEILGIHLNFPFVLHYGDPSHIYWLARRSYLGRKTLVDVSYNVLLDDDDLLLGGRAGGGKAIVLKVEGYDEIPKDKNNWHYQLSQLRFTLRLYGCTEPINVDGTTFLKAWSAADWIHSNLVFYTLILPESISIESLELPVKQAIIRQNNILKEAQYQAFMEGQSPLKVLLECHRVDKQNSYQDHFFREIMHESLKRTYNYQRRIGLGEMNRYTYAKALDTCMKLFGFDTSAAANSFYQAAERWNRLLELGNAITSYESDVYCDAMNETMEAEIQASTQLAGLIKSWHSF